MTKKIELTQGVYALVDDEDYEYLNNWKWYCSGGYATRHSYIPYKTLLMHRVVMGNPDGKEVDHINHDKTDNRKSNLRICTREENARNHPIHKNNTSGFKGVTWNKKANKWQAQIRHCGKNVHIGVFEDKESASDAYKEMAKKLFGDFA